MQQAAVNVAALSGTHKLYMVFKTGADNNFDVDSFTFGGNGVGTTPSGGIAGRTYTLTANHSNKLADVSGVSTADNAVVHQWAATGGANQRWQAVDAGSGNVYLKAVHSGKCMAVVRWLDRRRGRGGAADLQQPDQPASGRRSRPPAGVYQLRAVHSGKCLDVNGGSTADGGVAHPVAVPHRQRTSSGA